MWVPKLRSPTPMPIAPILGFLRQQSHTGNRKQQEKSRRGLLSKLANKWCQRVCCMHKEVSPEF